MSEMNIKFEGKQIVVTGAGKGIGRTITELLSNIGATVIAVSRTQGDLESLAQETGCKTITADLSDADAAHSAARQCLEFGEIHGLVNNTGISIPQPFLDTTIEAFDKTMAINVRAAMIFSQTIAKHMIERGERGSIVNLSSQASMVSLTEHTAYCSSKGALDQLTRTMALELGQHQIRVNAVNPTVTLTPMGEMAWGDPEKSGPMLAKIPLGKFAQPTDIAHAVAYLLSAYADMIHGTMLPVDGGFLST